MKDRLALLLLPLLLLVALFARGLPGARRAELPVPQATRFLDGTAAWHARRVSLALSARRLPQIDRFLSHPRATPLSDPPIYDTLLSLAARGLLGEAAGGPDAGPPDERRLEALLSRVGPALGLLLVLAVFAAARSCGARGSGAGLAAGAIVGLAPIAVSLGSFGKLHVEVWAALLLAAQLALAREAWTTRDTLDRLQSALLCGLLTGLGLASTPLFAPAALAIWSGFLLASHAAPPEEARDQARAGLLFSISAMLPCQLPSLEGPWRAAPPGPVEEWVWLSSGFLALGCAGFGLAFFRAGHRFRGRAFALGTSGVAALSLVLLVSAAPAAAGPAQPLRAALAILDAPAGDGAPRLFLPTGAPLAWIQLAPWLVLLAALGDRAARRLSPPERLSALLLLVLGLLQALVHPPAGLLFLVPAAIWIELGLVGPEAPGRLSLRAGRVLVAVALAGCVVALALGGLSATGEGSRRELVQALRWLRAESDPSGAWNAAGAAQDYGVLADPIAAALVPYHARRPTFASGPRATGDPEGLRRALTTLAAEDPEVLLERAREMGARYLVVVRGAPQPGPALEALADARRPVPPGAVRVFPPDPAEAELAQVWIYRLDAE